MARRSASDVLNWLRIEFLDLVLRRMNTTDVRRRIGLYGGDRIPENERNLTDVRNRVSLIAEYEMARVATRLLEEKDLSDLFFGYVVANRFPDLELRDNRGARGIRIEVKCLESVAEEKAANFDTLKKDIDPRTDFVVVFLWEWKHDGMVVSPSDEICVSWDRAPEFLAVYCFHAASLAHMRDWYWLNSPPSDVGRGLQGFDLRYGVNCKNGNYNEEEGNYGKLMRMWAENFDAAPPRPVFLEQTPEDYIAFRRSVIEQGFLNVCQALITAALPPHTASEPLYHEGKIVGMNAGAITFVLGSLCPTGMQRQILQDGKTERLFVLSDKYAWREVRLEGKRISNCHKENKKTKPKHLKIMLTNHLHRRLTGN